MRHEILLASVALALAGCETDKSALVGVYSNGMSEFSRSSVVLSSSGYGIFTGGIVGALGSWDVLHANGTHYLHMRCADTTGSDVSECDALFILDEESKSLEFAGLADDVAGALAMAKALPAERPFKQEKNYHYVTNVIPPDYERAIADFPADLERMKRQAANQKRQKEKELSRARKEQPIYEACLAEIKADPRKILTVPFAFYQEGVEPGCLKGRAKWTPEVKAVVDALGDKSIKFPEDVLMAFLDRYAWESYFYVIAPVFVRDELTAESRRKLHPRMRDYAERLDSEGAGAFYEHKNTPIDLVKDAYNWRGLKEALDRRLKKEQGPSESTASADSRQAPR
ncbi:MAG: hypothetical protein IJ829_00335 [Kiritimatiellae bacterium]|nr:hypothetical protein [Kiritimatiellia bacterium]